MASSINRRRFLRSAGAAAATGGALLAGAQAADAAAPSRRVAATGHRPQTALPLPPATSHLGITDFGVYGSASVFFDSFSASIYSNVAAQPLVGRLPLTKGDTLTSLVVYCKGPDTIKAELFVQDMDNPGTFLTPTPSVSVTTAAPTGTIALAIPAAVAAVQSPRIFQLRVTGTTSATTLHGATFTYTPVNSGFFAISPTRVYDSRESGANHGPILSDQTRDVSVANATAFSGGAADVVPGNAYAITYNLTATGATGQGFMAIYPKGGTLKASALNWFTNGEVVANGGVVTLDSNRTVTVQTGGGGSTDFIIDITGYYV
ncbi:MAG: hypothetical protein JWM34_3057 [Ilumatobacteraceae bacterium]|nr:hypothetical protein [Ilumatobacteraceae bacterium]